VTISKQNFKNFGIFSSFPIFHFFNCSFLDVFGLINQLGICCLVINIYYLIYVYNIHTTLLSGYFSWLSVVRLKYIVYNANSAGYWVDMGENTHGGLGGNPQAIMCVQPMVVLVQIAPPSLSFYFSIYTHKHQSKSA